MSSQQQLENPSASTVITTWKSEEPVMEKKPRAAAKTSHDSHPTFSEKSGKQVMEKKHTAAKTCHASTLSEKGEKSGKLVMGKKPIAAKESHASTLSEKGEKSGKPVMGKKPRAAKASHPTLSKKCEKSGNQVMETNPRPAKSSHATLAEEKSGKPVTEKKPTAAKTSHPTFSENKSISIPGVREVPGYENIEHLPFVRPENYIKVSDDELNRALQSESILYDADSDDEVWLKKLNTDVGTEYAISIDTFEYMIDELERAAFYQCDQVQEWDALAMFSDITADIVVPVYVYWKKKRKLRKKRRPLFKVLRPPQAKKGHRKTQQKACDDPLIFYIEPIVYDIAGLRRKRSVRRRVKWIKTSCREIRIRGALHPVAPSVEEVAEEETKYERTEPACKESLIFDLAGLRRERSIRRRVKWIKASRGEIRIRGAPKEVLHPVAPSVEEEQTKDEHAEPACKEALIFDLAGLRRKRSARRGVKWIKASGREIRIRGALHHVALSVEEVAEEETKDEHAEPACKEPLIFDLAGLRRKRSVRRRVKWRSGLEVLYTLLHLLLRRLLRNKLKMSVQSPLVCRI